MAQDVLAPGPLEPHDLDARDDSLPVLQDSLQRYGDIFRVPAQTRPNDGLVIHDADDIRRVLLTNRGNYIKGVGLERVRVLLGNGLIVSEGAWWAKQRRMMQPAFTSQVIRSFTALMHRVNQALLERWLAAAGRGEAINVTRDVSEAALDVVLRALFSTDLDRLIQTEGRNPFDLLAHESQRDLPFAARFRALTRHVLAMIDARRQAGRIEMDLLSMLLQARDKDSGEAMPDRAVLDEVMTLIVAGHETTASTLNWAWYLLSQHPQVEARLHAAVDSAKQDDTPQDDAPRDDAAEGGASNYVEQVLQETLRMYPPVWLFSRRALGDDVLSGYAVAAGTDIFICPYLLHRHPAHWREPEVFDPARFAPAAVAARHRFAFLPFSAGPRYCIGSTFAMTEMRIHLAMVARRLRLVYAGSEPPQTEFQVNLRTRRDLPMRAVLR